MASDHKLAPHIIDIKRALASDIDEDVLLEDFNTLVNTFHVPVEEAKRSIIKKYGVRHLAELRAGEREISVIVRVSSVKTRKVSIDGRQTIVSYGMLTDGSGTMPFIAHVERELNVGDVVAISHGCTRELAGKLTFDIMEPSTIVRVGHDWGLPIKKLTELRNGDRNINLLVQILTSELKKVGSRFITVGALADESGKLPFTSWGPHPDAGTVVRIDGAYVKNWRGIPTVNIGDMSNVFELDVEAQPCLETPKRVKIEELKMRDGTYDVIITGDIVSVRPGSGLIHRCPECERVIQKDVCRVHNKVRSRYALRIKAVVDDGTGDIMAVLGTTLTERIYGKTMDDVIEAIQEGTSLDGVERDIKRGLTGHSLTLRGNATKGDYDVVFVAQEAEIEPGGITDRVQKIKDRLEELLTQ
jgi:replication factor A1